MDIYNGLNERIKKIKAISMLGTKRQLGSLTDYAQTIAIQILLYVMKQEMLESENRKYSDLVIFTKEILNRMNINANEDEINTMVESIIACGEYDKREPFEVKIFDQNKNEFENFKYRYLMTDRKYTDLENGGKNVYKLTNISKEIIFITREILEEYGFSVEQFYVSQLIKNGNFKEAKSGVDNLIIKAKDLIEEEQNYYESMLRNPKNIYSKNRNLDDDLIKKQFKEEEKVFDKMIKWEDYLLKTEFDENKKLGKEIFEKLEHARLLHDVLTQKFVENIELKIKIETKFIELLWDYKEYSFKENIWENIIEKNGLNSMDDFEYILSPLFSPETEFIYPLDWAIKTQKTYEKIDNDLKDLKFEVDEGYKPKPIDYNLLVKLFKPIFKKLLEKGDFKIGKIKKDKLWLKQKINIELLMMFVTSSVTLKKGKFEDNRLIVFNKILEKNKKFEKLVGKTIKSDFSGTSLTWENLEITPYRLFIEGEENG
mgnify:CR=1 FL=1